MASIEMQTAIAELFETTDTVLISQVGLKCKGMYSKEEAKLSDILTSMPGIKYFPTKNKYKSYIKQIKSKKNYSFEDEFVTTITRFVNREPISPVLLSYIGLKCSELYKGKLFDIFINEQFQGITFVPTENNGTHYIIKTSAEINKKTTVIAAEVDEDAAEVVDDAAEVDEDAAEVDEDAAEEANENAEEVDKDAAEEVDEDAAEEVDEDAAEVDTIIVPESNVSVNKIVITNVHQLRFKLMMCFNVSDNKPIPMSVIEQLITPTYYTGSLTEFIVQENLTEFKCEQMNDIWVLTIN